MIKLIAVDATTSFCFPTFSTNLGTVNTKTTIIATLARLLIA